MTSQNPTSVRAGPQPLSAVFSELGSLADFNNFDRQEKQRRKDNENYWMGRLFLESLRNRGNPTFSLGPKQDVRRSHFEIWVGAVTASFSDSFPIVDVISDMIDSATSLQFSSVNPRPLARQGDWASYRDSEGFVYYFNSRTGESQWHPPTNNFPIVQDSRPLVSQGAWDAYWDADGTGLVYYFNRMTGESSWNPPTHNFPTVSTPAAPLVTRGPWSAYRDSSNQIYYFNSQTGKSQWEKPTANFPIMDAGTRSAPTPRTEKEDNQRAPVSSRSKASRKANAISESLLIRNAFSNQKGTKEQKRRVTTDVVPDKHTPTPFFASWKLPLVDASIIETKEEQQPVKHPVFSFAGLTKPEIEVDVKREKEPSTFGGFLSTWLPVKEKTARKCQTTDDSVAASRKKRMISAQEPVIFAAMDSLAQSIMTSMSSDSPFGTSAKALRG